MNSGPWFCKGKKYTDLSCKEVFVYQPPTLKSIASAKIIDNDLLLFECINRRHFRQIADDPIEVVQQEYSRGNTRYWKSVGPAYKYLNSIDVIHAHPFSSDHIAVPIGQVNDNARIERRERVKKQLLPYFESKRTRITYEE